ncbi:MAG: diadenylate cyclase [Syntrophales bacterium]|nr:diadenylate cyclase [Syntrophales bacterium]MDD5531335.1 diadenylate cyclase [Syntrophales bacterium]
MNEFTSIWNTFRIQDVFDILIIALMIYGFLIWFKKTASRFVLAGILLMGLIYVMSRFFQLYMTAVILQGFFAVLFFALIVIFQEELRRFFERIALWGRIRKRTYSASFEHEIEVIIQTAANMAKRKTGGLLVLQGEELLDRHLEGGIRLEGVLSQPLLESIFDPNSMGHDGAVIISQGRVVQFGCHLPLSSNSAEFGNLGLRHTAALGLSERSDALCIVISEEKGTISVALDKKIEVLEKAAALRAILENFYAERFPKEKPRAAVSWIRENAGEKITAVGLAVVLWLGLGYQRETVQREVTVPIEYRNLSPEWIIEEPKATEARVMLTGPAQAFQLYNPSSLKISLDLAQVRQGGQEIALSKSMMRTPANISIVGLKPDRIYINAYKLVPLSAPVDVKTSGSLPAGFSLQKIEVMPSSVTVLVSPRQYKNNIRLRTRAIDMRNITSTVVLTPELIVPTDVRFPGDKMPSVVVTLRVRQRG